MSGTRRSIPLRDASLLASVKIACDDGTTKTLCFGNILELESDALVLESKRELEIGAALILNVAFPGVERSTKSVVSLSCVVEEARDSVGLHYDLSIEYMDDVARLQLAEFRSLRGLEKVD